MAWPSLADIRARVRENLNEATASFWSNAQLNRWINDCERDIAVKGKCIVHIDPISASFVSASTISFVDSNPDTIYSTSNFFVSSGFTVGQQITTSSALNPGPFKIGIVDASTLTLDSANSLTAESAGASVSIFSRSAPFRGLGVKQVEYVPSSGSPITLAKITPDMLGHVISKGNTPQYWFPWGEFVIIEPKPTASYNLNLYVWDYPMVEMVSDTDTPTIPLEFHELLTEGHGVFMALIKDRKYSLAVKQYLKYLHNLQIARMLFEGNKKSSPITLTSLPEVTLTASQARSNS